MKKLLFVSLSVLILGFTSPAPVSILDKVDKNMSSINRIVEATMTINRKRNTKTLTSKTWSEGTKKSFTEYLSPATDKGTKMLKLDGQLWIYSPSTDRIIEISGNMLRQSVMGSDLSYEDMMDDRKMTDLYTEKLIKTDTLNGTKVWLIELTAKVTDIAYYSQKMWVDTAKCVPLKQELYAKSGTLLKKIEYKNVKYVQGRWFPYTYVYKDMLKDSKGTEFKITSILFNQTIPAATFAKAALKQ